MRRWWKPARSRCPCGCKVETRDWNRNDRDSKYHDENSCEGLHQLFSRRPRADFNKKFLSHRAFDIVETERRQKKGPVAANDVIPVPVLKRSGFVAFKDRQPVDRDAGQHPLIADGIDGRSRVAIVPAVAGNIDNRAIGRDGQEREHLVVNDL